MVSQVLELSSSPAGWYWPYTSAPAPVEPAPAIPSVRPAPPQVSEPEETAAWLYGPDGRLRQPLSRPRISILA